MNAVYSYLIVTYIIDYCDLNSEAILGKKTFM
jgi:hypothetical protein